MTRPMPDWMPDPALPEGGIPTAALTVVCYLNPHGEAAYVVGFKGDSPMTSYLGMTVLAQQEIVAWRHREEP